MVFDFGESKSSDDMEVDFSRGEESAGLNGVELVDEDGVEVSGDDEFTILESEPQRFGFWPVDESLGGKFLADEVGPFEPTFLGDYFGQSPIVGVSSSSVSDGSSFGRNGLRSSPAFPFRNRLHSSPF